MGVITLVAWFVVFVVGVGLVLASLLPGDHDA